MSQVPGFAIIVQDSEAYGAILHVVPAIVGQLRVEGVTDSGQRWSDANVKLEDEVTQLIVSFDAIKAEGHDQFMTSGVAVGTKLLANHPEILKALSVIVRDALSQ